MGSSGLSLTPCGVQAAATSFTLEVLSLLMVDEDFEIVKITFAVVAPWSRKLFLNVRMTSLLLRHLPRIQMGTSVNLTGATREMYRNGETEDETGGLEGKKIVVLSDDWSEN